MKTCPICKSRCFDDMPICYGCLHDFERDQTEAALASSDAASPESTLEAWNVRMPQGGGVAGEGGVRNAASACDIRPENAACDVNSPIIRLFSDEVAPAGRKRASAAASEASLSACAVSADAPVSSGKDALFGGNSPESPFVPGGVLPEIALEVAPGYRVVVRMETA